MIADVQVVDFGAIFGWAGLFAIVLTAIAWAWAITRSQRLKAEEQNAASLREGFDTMRGRLDQANKWNTVQAAHLAECEKTIAEREATLVEKDQLVASLEDRIDSQRSHIDKLVDWTPLLVSIERHAEAAASQWREEDEERRAIVVEVNRRLDEILARVDAIAAEVRPERKEGNRKTSS